LKEYDVTIIETLKKTVTVEAESQDEAEQIVSDNWHNSEYILDADDFVSVEFESAEPTIELSYREMSDMFSHINKVGLEHVCGYIVFAEDSFDKTYSEESRTYVVSSNNKAYIPGAGGYSIYGSCLDGTDQNIRLEGYMRGDKAWHIERCYMRKEDYNHCFSQPDKDEKHLEER